MMIEAETNAITIGLLCAVTIGFIVLVVCVINAVFGRHDSPCERAGKTPSLAEDFTGADEWEMAERYNRERMGKK